MPRRARIRRNGLSWNSLSYERLEDRRVLSAITKVQDFAGSQFQTGVTSYSLSVPNAVAAGHTLLVEVAIDSSGTVSVSDSAGDTFTKDADNSNGVGPKTRNLVYHSTGVAGLSAGQSITVSFPSTATAKAVAVQEFSGITSVSPFDESVANRSNSTSPSSGSLGSNTAQANELLIGSVSVQNGTSAAISFTAGANYTALSSASTTDATGPNQQINPEYQVVSATNRYSATGTLGATSQWEDVLAAYKADTVTHYAISGILSSTSAGSAFNITVTAEDSSNATVTGYVGTVHFSSTDAQAGLPSDYAFTASDAGVHTFSVTLKTVGSQTITATDLNDSAVTASTNSITVNVGATSKLVVGGPGSATAGSAFNTLTVTAEDAYGNTTPAYVGTIHFTSSDGSAVLPANYTFVSANAGVQTFSVTLKASGSQTVTATDTTTGTITGTTGAISVAAATATSLSVSAPANATAGTAVNVTITAKDQFGNTATGYTGTVKLTSSDGSAVLPGNYTFVAGDAGVKTVSVTLKTSGNQTLTAADTASSSISGTSGAIAVAAASVSTLSISAPASSTAGASFNVTVTTKDQYGNIATGYTGTVHFTSTDGSAVLPSNYTFISGDAGIHTFNVTLKTSGNRTITATDTVTGTVTGTSGTIAVAAASAASLSVTAPASATAGSAFNVTVTALDAYGNTATSYVGDVHFTSSDTSAVLPGDYTFGSSNAGTATFSVTLKTSGNRTLTATDTVSGSVTGTSAAIAVAAGTATTLSLSASTTATAGTAVNVTITAKDVYGNTATGYTGTVHLTSTDGSAVLPANYTFVSGDAGVHTLSVTLKTAGSQTVTATDTASGSIAGTTGTVAVSAAAASSFTLAGPATTSAGTSFNVTITAKDQYGNVATGYTGTIHVTSSDGQAILPANYSFIAANAGVHTVNVTLKTSGNQTVTATDTVTSSITGLTSNIAVAASSATHFSVTAPASGTAGSACNLTVTALDAYGNTAVGYVGTITFSSTNGAAVLPANYTFASANAGAATFSVTLKTSGSQTVTATDTVTGSIAGTSSSIAVAAAAASSLTLSAPTSTTAGSAVSVTITAKDSYGNTATSYTGTVHFTSSDSSAVLPANYTFIAGDGGVKVVSVTFKTAGNQTVAAADTVTGSIAGTSGGVAVAAGTASTLAVSAPTTTTAGTAVNVIITAKDQYGNIATGYTGTVHLTSSDGQAVLPSNYTFVAGDAGVHTLSVTLKTSGAQTVTATDTVTGSINGITGSIGVSAAAATHLTVTAPASATAGTAFNVTVTALDAYGNTASGYAGTVHFTSSDPAAVLPADYSFSSANTGTDTFSATLKTSGSRTITATDTVTGSITGVSGSIAVAAASAATFTVSGPTSASAGSAINATITAKDAYGNTATSYTGTVHFTSSDGHAALPANYTFIAGDAGVKTVSLTLKTAGNQTVTATDISSGSVTGVTSPINVSAAAASTLSIGAPAIATAGSAFNVTLTAKDPYGNTASGYTGTVYFTASDGVAVLPGNYAFTGGDAGVHVFSVTLKTAGSETVTATDTVTASITGTSGAISTAAAAAATLTVSTPATATAGTAFNVTVTAFDAYGNTATSYAGTVHFASNDLAAVLPSSYTFASTNAGTATFSVTLKTVGNRTVTATDTTTTSITGTSGAVAVAAAGASSFSLNVPANSTAGAATNVTVTAKDAYGNTATSYAGTVHLTSTDFQAALPANYTFVSADAGVHTLSVTLKTSGSQTVTATDTATTSINGASSGIAVAATSATHLAVSAPASVTAGSSYSVVVTALDAYGNTATGYLGTIHFTSTDPGAPGLPADYTFVAGDGGAHSFSVSLKTAGSQTITATDTTTSSITGVTPTIAVAAASATHFNVTAAANATAGTAFNVAITALDAYGNTATAYTGTVHFTSTDASAVVPADYTFSAGNAGTGVFSVTLKSSGSQKVTATDRATSSITGTSQSIATAPAAATELAVAGPATATAGASFNLTVTALDPYGNTATGYTGTIRFTSSDSSAALPANSTLTNGVGDFSVTLKTSGNQTITGSDTLTSTISGTTSTIATTNAAASQFTIVAPTSVNVGVPFNIAVTARDAYGNAAIDYAGTAHFTSSDSGAVLPADSTLSAGTGTFSVTLTTSGSKTVTATDTVTSTITGTSGAISSVAAATHLSVSAPANVIAGTPFNITITALDHYGNVATNYSGTVHFTSTDGAVVLPGDYTFGSGNAGVATFAVMLKTAGSATITATDDATASIAGVSGAISTSPAAPSHFSVSIPANSTAGNALSITVTALDAYGNTTTAYAGTVHFSSRDSQALLPADTTLTSGSGTFNVTLKTAGNQTISATDTTNGSITATSGGVAVAASTATRFGLSTPTTATAAAPFNVAVTALDAYGNTATGYTGTVHFTSSDPAAILPANGNLTNGAGTFNVTLKTAGSETVTATDTISASIAGTSSALAITPAAATHFVVSATSTTTAGSAFNVSVTALDASGNVATGYLGKVHLTSTDGAALLPGDYTFSAGNAGVAAFSVTLTTAGNQAVTATDTASGSVSGTSGTIATAPAAASHFGIAVPANATAGAAFTITLTALDPYGNTASSYTGTVHFTTSDAQALLPADYTFAAGDAGIASFSATLKTSGNQTIGAADTTTSSISGTGNTIATAAAVATHFAVTAPGAATVGAAFNIVVTAMDQYGNTVTGYSGTIHFTSSDGAAVLPANTTLTNGTGTFGVTLKTSGSQTLTAADTVTGSLAGTSNAIATTAAAATHFSVSAPANATAGTAFNITVTALDAYGNTATGYTGTIHFTSGDSAAVLPGDYTFSAANGGVDTFSAALKTAGIFTITATDVVTNSITGTSANIGDAAATATHFVVSAPSSATAGSSFNVTITALDSYGNTAIAYSGTVQFTSTDAAAVLPINSGLTAGTATFSVTLKTAGNQTITATDTVSGSLNGTSGPISTSAAAATHFTVAAPTNAAVGLAFNTTVTAQDAYGNTVTTYSGTVHFTSTDTAAVLPADSSLTSGVGTFVVLLKSVGNQTLTATDTVTETIAGSSGTIPTIGAPATHFAIAAPATAYAGAAFTITVTALDPYGNTDIHYTGTVHFASSDGSAELPGNYTFTTANAGTHTFAVILKTSGNQTVAATDTVSGAVTGTSGTIDTAPANDTHFVFSGPGTAIAGSSFNLTVTAEDALGNTVTGYSGTLHFTSSDAAAVLPSDARLTNGTGTFSITLETSGTQTLTAVDTSDNSINGSELVATSAAPASQFVFAAPATTTAGVSFNATLTAEDAYGNIDTDYTGTVHFTSSDTAAVLPNDYTFAGANNGAANFSITLKTSGNQTITATDTVTSSIVGTKSAVATVSATATHVSVVAPANATAGTAFNITVKALDAYGNTATGYTGTVHLTSSDGAAVLPANSTLTAGMATFSVTLKTSGVQTITATDSATSSICGTSSLITTVPAAATHFVVSSPASATAGAAFNVTVTARDAYGNTATGYGGTVHFTSSDPGSPGLPADATLTAGVGTFSVTLKTSGNQTVTATDTVSPTITGTTIAIAMTAGAATHYTVSAPGTATAGVAFNVTVTALDAFGNTATGYSGSVHFTSSDGAAVLPGNSTLTNGVGTFSVTLKTSGNQTVGATDVVDGLITGTSAMIATSAAAAVQVAVSAPATTTAGGAFNITVTALDAYGNTATGYTGTVHFSSSDGAAVLPGDGTLTSGTGTLSVTLNSAGSRTIAATDTMAGSISGTSGSIAVTASAATHFTVSAAASTSAGTAVNVTVTALDAYGNTAIGYTGSVHFTSSDALATLPADYTFAAANAGVGTFSVTPKTAGNQTITATDTVTSSISGTSGAMTVSPGVATHYHVSGPATATAGSSFSVSVTALDAYGNTATGYAGIVQFASSDAAAVLPANSTLTAGTGSFNITLKTAGNQTITATDTVSGSMSGTSAIISTAAAAATHFSVSTSATATAGNALNFSVTALDAYGNASVGYTGTVHFTSSDGAAVLPADATLTNGTGTFSITLKAAGSQTVTATDTVSGSITGVSRSIAVSAATAMHFSVTTPANTTAGASFSMTLTALDQYGNVASGYTGTVHFTSSDTSASLPSNYTFAGSNAGIAIFSVTLTTAGNQTITATDTSTGSVHGTSGTIAVAAAVATQFLVAAPANTTAGVAFNITVTALDAYGNTATGDAGTVQFSSSDGQAVLPANSTLTAGVGTVSTTLKTSGSQTLTASDLASGSLNGTTSAISVAAAAATSLTISAPATTTAGTAFNITVTAHDAYGNIATGYGGTLAFTSNDASAVLQATSGLAAGVGTFSVTLTTAGSRTITATDTANASITGTTAAVATSAAAATHYSVSAPNTAMAGTAFNVTVTALDPYGNTATGYAGTVHLTSSDPSAVLPANSPLAGGVRAFSITLKTSGNQAITATDTVSSSIDGTSSTIATSPASATHFTVTAPSTATAGAALSFTATALDPYGNVATAYSGTVHFSSSDAAATLPADTTLSSGIGTFNATLKTAGSQSITATDTATASIIGASAAINTSPAAATHFAVTTPAGATAGTAFNVTVTAVDAYGNTATGYGGTVHFTSSDSAAVLHADSTLTGGVGAFSVTLKTAGAQTITATDTVSGSINGTSGAVLASAATATHFRLTAPASATAGTAFNVTVTALDAYGNTATNYVGTIHFTSSDGIAALSSDYTFSGANAGTEVFSVTLKTAGNQTITATDSVTNSITGTSGAVATAAAAATHFAIATAANATAGSAINATITALDAYGNTAAGYLGTVHLTSTDGAAVLPADYSFVSGDAGVHVLSVTLKTAGRQTITATDTVTNSIAGASSAITVSAAAASALVVSAPTTAIAGSALTLSVTAFDSYGNIATAYSGTVHFTSSDNQAGLPTNSTLTGGAGTFTVTLKTAGSQTVTVTDTVTSSITGASGAIAVTPAAAAHLSVTAPTSATAGAAFNVTVTALDAFGNTATGYAGAVHFSSSDAGAILPADYTFASANAGTATFSATLKTAGNQTVTATDIVTGSINGTSGTIALTANTATHFTLTAPAAATAGTAFNLTVTAQDAYGNQATGYAGTVHFTSSDALATLPGNSTLTAGIGTFSVALKISGNQTLTASDVATGSIAGTTSSIATAAAAATSLIVSAPMTATAGTALNVTVTAHDAYGNTATGYSGTITFTSSDGAAVLPANSTLTAGIGSFSVTLKTAGNRTITATDTVTGSITGTSAAVATSASTATHYRVTAPATASDGTAFNVTVTALDAYGNTATGYAGTLHFTSSDGQATLPANSTLTSGAGTFSITLRTSGNQTITAADTSTGTINGTSNVVAASPATAAHLTVSAPATATAGAAFSVTVTAVDQYGNVATGYTGTIHFTTSDAAATLPADATLTAGVGTFSVTLKTAGNQTLTATDTSSGSISGVSPTIGVSPATATHFTVSAPTSATAGTAFNVTATALDAYGNTATGYLGSVRFTSTDGAAVLPGNYAFSGANAGVETFSVTMKTVGNQTLTVTDVASSSISGVSGAVAVAANAATHFAVTTPASATAGTAFNVTVTALDAYGNTAIGYGGTVHFTSSDGRASLPSDSTLVNGVGSFSATLKTSGSQTVTASDVATGSVNGTSASIATAAAAANSLSVTAPGSATAGTPFTITVTARDQYGNTATGYAGTVTFSSSDGAAALPANTTLTAGAGTFNVTLKTADSRTITASDTVTGSISGTSPAVINSAAVATHYSVTAPTNAVAGTAFNVTVTALDAYGNTATDYTGTVHFTSSDSQAVLPSNSALTAGVGTFNVTLKSSGSQTIAAVDTAVAAISGTSGSVATTATAATHLGVTAPTNATAGTAFNITIKALDAYGNIATSYGGTVHFTSSDAAAVLPANTTLTGGLGTFNTTLKTAGNQTITATDIATGSISGVSPIINTLAASATQFKLTTATGATAGTALNLTVTAIDAYGNTATGYVGTVHFTSTDSAAGLPHDYSFSGANAGTGTFSVTLKTAGSQTVSVTDTVTHSITATTSSITVVPGAAAQFLVAAPASIAAGTSFSFSVTARDAYGNTVSAYSGTVAFTSIDNQAVLPASNTLSGGTGTFTATLKTAGDQTITATDVAARTINGTCSTAVAADAATTFSVTTPNNAAVGAGFPVTVVARDPFGNADSGYSGTVQFTSSDGSAVLPPNATLSGGTGTFTVTLNTVGIQTVTASDTVTTSISGTSGLIGVSLMPVTGFTITAPASTEPGTAFSITVTAVDADGDPINTYTGAVHFSSTDAAAVLPSDYTFTPADAGSETFSVTLNTAGSDTVMVADSAHPAIIGVTTPISVAAPSITISGVPVAGYAGAPLVNVVLGSFTCSDSGLPAADFQANVDWGDGSSSAGEVTATANGYQVLGSHTYNGMGPYKITVTASSTLTESQVHDTASIVAPLLADGTRGTVNERLVSALYFELLNRPVNPGGLVFFTNILDQGASLSDVVEKISTSNEYFANEANSLFEQYLHRDAEPAALAWAEGLLSDGRPVEPLELALVTSPEYVQQRCADRVDLLLENLYHDALGRDIDPTALAYYEPFITDGASWTSIAGGILTSGEFIADYLGAQFQRLLNHTADPAGLTDLAVDLSTDPSTQNVMTLIAQLPEASDFFQFVTN